MDKLTKTLLTCVIALTALGYVVLLTFPASAQTGGVWSKPAETVALALDQDHTKLVALVKFLEGKLTQAQINQIESNLFPQPTKTEKLQALERMKEFRDRTNMDTSTIPEIQALATAIDAAYDVVITEPDDPQN